MELTTGRYDHRAPSPVVLQLAHEPAHPVLPKRIQPRSSPKTRRERIPLTASLTGPGRAGTETTLLGNHGNKYTGQVLAGRPHGCGQFWAQGNQPGQPLQLVYEGEFLRSVRHGQGTAYFHSRGEVYSGQWMDGRRTGAGKLTYADGSEYDGMWSKDVRHGVGTLSSPSGSIFVGTFVNDKRQGLGVTYWGSRCKKYVAEYIDDTATCGTVMSLEDELVEPPATQQLREAIAAARLAAAGAAGGAVAGSGVSPELPELQLVQPGRVLSREFSAVRQWRERQQLDPAHQATTAATTAAAALDAVHGTFMANSMNLLRHAFILIAGGDDLAAHVLPHQLQELVVLAGLDPAASALLHLLGLLHQRIEARGVGRLYLDDLMDVVNFFRQQPLAVQQQLQQQAAAAEAAAAAEVADVSDIQAQQLQVGVDDEARKDGDGMAEVWQEEGEMTDTAAAAAAGASNSLGGVSDEGPLAAASVWGVSSDEDMLARHIASHRPQPPS